MSRGKKGSTDRPAAVRGRGKGWWRRGVDRGLALWLRLLETPVVWLLLLLSLGTWSLLPRGLIHAPAVAAGSIAVRDYVAPEDLLLPDEETTQLRQQRAREEVPPVYDFDPNQPTAEELTALFEAGRRLLAEGEEAGGSTGEPTAVSDELAGEVQEASDLRVAREAAAVLLAKGFPPQLEERLRGLAVQVLRRGVVASKELLLENRLRGITLRNLDTRSETQSFDLYDYLGYPDEVRDLVESEVRDWGDLTGSERRALVNLLVANLLPNLHINSSETLARREAAATAIPPSLSQYRRGQVIVRKGDEIDAVAARLINSYRTGERRLRDRLLPALGTFLLLALAALVMWLALRNERVADHSRRRLFGESLLLLVASILGAKLSFVVAEALAGAFDAPPLDSVRGWALSVPFAALALCSALLLGRHVALVLAPVFSLLMSRMVGAEGLWVVIFSLAGSLAAIYALDLYQVKQRLVMARVGLVVGGVNVVTVLMLQALAGMPNGLMQLGFHLICAFAGGLLAAAVASFAVPILESALGIATEIKLAELANTNLPLLRRLAFEAPGSFQHSMMVANLAKQACEAIGADSTLAYTGGLYHDVGKVFRAEYFIENQRPGQNPHDRLQPTMSALVLISHIKDGVGLARQHHLPQPILDAIEQHHGTRLIKFFYNRAVEQAGDKASTLSEEKFRYPGPKPQSKVMGVLMLADAVEAASRTLTDPAANKIRGLIRTIVEDCQRDGQLDRTDLTLSDLRRVSESFQRVLANIFHHRVDYPGFNFNAGPGEAREKGEKREKQDRRLAAVGGTAP